MKRLLDVTALGGAMIGSLLIAANIGITQIGYVFFLLSSIASVMLLMNSNASRSLYFTNMWFILMNVIGLVRY